VNNLKGVKKYAGGLALSALAVGAIIAGISAQSHVNSPATEVAQPLPTTRPSDATRGPITSATETSRPPEATRGPITSATDTSRPPEATRGPTAADGEAG
jgi:hypothetical protein